MITITEIANALASSQSLEWEMDWFDDMRAMYYLRASDTEGGVVLDPQGKDHEWSMWYPKPDRVVDYDLLDRETLDDPDFARVVYGFAHQLVIDGIEVRDDRSEP